jgi:Restriction endonuclease/DnaJ domain
MLGEVLVPAMALSVLFVVLSLIFPFAGLSLGKQVEAPSDLTRLSTDEREMITSACGLDRQINGPAQHYYDCIGSQLAALRASPGKPDLTHLAPATRDSIRSACELDRQINGPALYYDCLRDHLASLGISRVTTPGHTPASDAQQRPTGTPDGPSSATSDRPKSQGLVPAILLVATLCGLVFIFYLYNRSRWRECSCCGSHTPNSTRICDSCQARFRAAEIHHREEQERQEAEARAEQQRRGEKETQERLRSLEDLQRLTGAEFERLIASLFMRDGYKVSRWGGSGDEGVDMVLEMGGSKDVVQFKRWNGEIGPPVILEFYRSMMQAGARRGFVIATASFTHSAKELVDRKPITLIDGHYLLAWISWAGLAAEDARAAQRGSDFDPYEVLGISSSASKDEIRSAYRSLVAKYHPDKVAHLGHEFQAIAREKAIVINEAFEMLNHS